MKPLSPVLASLANVFKIPLSQTSTRPATNRVCNEAVTSKTTTTGPITAAVQPAASRTFSTTSALAKRKAGTVPPQVNKRITMIRYFLWHPLTPRPLRFSRNRYLRHWTIHRAWQLYQAQQRRAHHLELERQEHAMHRACEELRTGAYDGGKLFRKSMNKKGVFADMFPIEYGRLQTDAPSREGWNHEWKRMEKK
ncbi:mitochondrial 54S ribosomal protein mL40 [Aspergillus chevalieri]|uniref:Uncharacterized protein n=1 Tax=Aspergillus chevalieri TaxID=182096 RepID=A0A7R7ZLX7_ASPCH|nr:uncharacterized protein ACHE_21005S [Aspergillus chevalieri]BCR85547.1 hypothetical protein ACHE_21005S [Aspergillus chevalieri]